MTRDFVSLACGALAVLCLGAVVAFRIGGQPAARGYVVGILTMLVIGVLALLLMGRD